MAATLAPSYSPLDVALTRGKGAHVWDEAGTEYLDFLAGYSALNFGHGHPALLAAAHAQLDTLTLTSRAFTIPLLATFADALTTFTGTEMMLPMNTGAEAVETAVKAARKWGSQVRGVAEPVIIVAEGSFHGRTMTAVSMSTDPVTRTGFGPFLPGFRTVPFGDADAVAAALDDDVVAILLEPIQGEAGVVIPPADYLPRLRAMADDAGILLILDEIQSGLGRTGTTLAADVFGVKADLTCLGKALGGGLVPVSAVVGRADVLGVFTPGTHGSTFGGNPLACAVGLAVIDLLTPGDLQQRAGELGEILTERLEKLAADSLIESFRSCGLWAGVDVEPRLGLTGKEVCVRLAEAGVLAKDTHGHTIRFSPPLVISEADLTTGLDALESVLRG